MGGFNGLMVDDISEPAVISGVHFACDQQSQPQRRNCETQPLGEKGLSYAAVMANRRYWRLTRLLPVPPHGL
jgi:hypothetical protein